MKYSEIYTNGQYQHDNPMWSKSDSLFKTKPILELLTKHAIIPKDVCEIGCGNGEILKILSETWQNANFLGIDISEQAIVMANNSLSENLHFQQADILDPEFQFKKLFDLTLSIDILEHLENYFEYLRKIQRSSKYAVFHIPLDMSIWTLFREKMLLESKNRVGHIHNFSQDFILSVLSDMGFEVVDITYTQPNYIPKGLKAHFIYKLRKIIFRINQRLCAKTIGGLSLLVLTKTENL